MEELDEKRKKRRKRKKSKRKKSSGKKDACYYKVKARYSVWPSAYASGALSKCRKVGAKNWGNKSKKRKTNEGVKLTEDLIKEMIRELLKEEKDKKKKEKKEKEFKRPPMYDPITGKMVNANKPEDHKNLAEKGYTHVNPKILIKVLKAEGGAAGMEPFVKATKADKKEIEKTLKAMPKVGQHEDGDYILADDKEIRVVKKIKEAVLKEIANLLDEKKKRKKRKKSKRKKAGSESSKESSLRDWFKRKGAKGKKGGWVDCNAPDGKGGYKPCGRQKGEKRKKYPACRPTPAACRERGKGKSWGKKAARGKK